jgi:hypothetical protein
MMELGTVQDLENGTTGKGRSGRPDEIEDDTVRLSHFFTAEGYI